jgi:uncharacterized protein (TIGR02246 family)
MKEIVFLSVMILAAFSATAQSSRQEDAAAIETQVDAMVESWNKHDHAQMAAYATEDFSWVNIVGMWWKNRKEVQFSTQLYHEVMFKTTPMKKIGVFVRFIRDDVAVVHFKSHVGTFSTPDGHQMPDNDEIALLVFVKQDGVWLMTAGENVIIDPVAQKNDPVLRMPK